VHGLFLLALAAAGLDAPTGRATVVTRPREAMIAIAPGSYTMGASQAAAGAAVEQCKKQIGSAAARLCENPNAFPFVNEQPERKVFISGFQIDRVEVTVAAYRACVHAGACAPEPLAHPDQRFQRADLPVTWVTWGEAARYCEFRGGRLPTEAEWERAARGLVGRVYPWGNESRDDTSNHGRFQVGHELGPMPMPLLRPDPADGHALLAPVGSYTRGASPEGVLDLAGNVSEWTADVFSVPGPQLHMQVNPRGPLVGGERTVRGGSWRQPLVYQRATWRVGLPEATRSAEVGFRCAR
jgi:formylglycine-generating enzyme required for sulfatase activity